MQRYFLGFALSSVFALSLLFTACEKETAVENLAQTTVTDFINDAIYEIESRGNIGRFGCYDFVFPITINFPDESSVEVEDYEAWKAAIRTWKEANPEAEAYPELAFPVELLDEEGELITVESAEALKALKKECAKEFFECKPRDRECRRERAQKCFTFVFPLSIEFPDGETVAVEDAKALKRALKTWHSENRDTEEKPSLVFPLQVELADDGGTLEIADAEALKSLRTSCREDG
ncbi:MAG: hypothetical protein AAGI49_12155 [Bacteroidota bacterium]